jgi:hypothetical protein
LLHDCIEGLQQDGAKRFFTIFEEGRSKAWLPTSAGPESAAIRLQQDDYFILHAWDIDVQVI